MKDVLFRVVSKELLGFTTTRNIKWVIGGISNGTKWDSMVLGPSITFGSMWPHKSVCQRNAHTHNSGRLKSIPNNRIHCIITMSTTMKLRRTTKATTDEFNAPRSFECSCRCDQWRLWAAAATACSRYERRHSSSSKNDLIGDEVDPVQERHMTLPRQFSLFPGLSV